MTGEAELQATDPPALLDAADFMPHVDDTFEVGQNDEIDTTTIPFVLEAVVEVVESSDSIERTPFTLTFTGPSGDHLPQGVYDLQHPTLGQLAIFLVPIGPRGDGRHRYEAVFN
jgi:hypothetical protein